MFCSKCGKDVANNMTFCDNCGNRLYNEDEKLGVNKSQSRILCKVFTKPPR